MYTTKNRAPRKMKQTDRIEGRSRHFSKNILRFQYVMLKMDRTTREKINKRIEDLNYTTNQLDLTDTSRILYSNPAKYTFFSSVTFSRRNYTLDHKTGLHKSQRTEIHSLTTDSWQRRGYRAEGGRAGSWDIRDKGEASKEAEEGTLGFEVQSSEISEKIYR